MKRMRLGTLMLLIVIAALVMGMLGQEWRYRRLQAEHRAELMRLLEEHEKEAKEMVEAMQKVREMEDALPGEARDGR